MPRVVSLLVAMVILFVGVMTSIPLWREKAVQHRLLGQLQEERGAEQQRQRQLDAAIISVRSDRSVVERLAREKFGLARPGEVVFKFRGDLPAGSAATVPIPPPVNRGSGQRQP